MDKRVAKALKNTKSVFEKLDKIALSNQEKVIEAFKTHGVALRHFNGTSGYGSDDVGKNTLCNVVASIFVPHSKYFCIRDFFNISSSCSPFRTANFDLSVSYMLSHFIAIFYRHFANEGKKTETAQGAGMSSSEVAALPQ